MKRFGVAALRAIHATKYFRIRCGTAHRHIAIWVVVVDGRVLVRPWNDRRTGWYRAFLEEPRGSVKVGKRDVPVRARPVRAEKLNEAVSRAYSQKYTTKANQKYVKGFSLEKRKATTLELVPL